MSSLNSDYVDYSDDMGLIEPEELIQCAQEAGEFVFDLETTGLSAQRDRIEGVAFYVPPSTNHKEVRAWFPFVDHTFMCHMKVGDLPAKLDLFRSIGVDVEEIEEQIKDLGPDELTLVDIRPALPIDETMERLRPIWEDLTNTVAAGHNVKFDEAFLYYKSGTDRPIVVRNILGDSMLADFCSDETKNRYGLKYRVKQEFGHQMVTYKDAVRGQSLLAFCNAKPLGSYAQDDCYWSYRLHKRALTRLREQTPADPDKPRDKWSAIEKQLGHPMGKLERIYWGIDCKISKILMEMENSGVLIDWQWLMEVEERLRNQKNKLSDRIERFLGWPLNPNSGPQVADALFASPPDGLGLPQAGIPIGKTGHPSTADKIIKHFSRFHPLVADILKWRSLDTILSGFVVKLIALATESPDGRVYARFNQVRTVIARLSCVHGSTILDTSHGSVRISELDLSDGRNYTVETHCGRRRQILRRYYKGREEMFDVETEDGRKITCTAKHRFLTPQGWRALGDLGVGDRLIVRAGVHPVTSPETLGGETEAPNGVEFRANLHQGAEDANRADGTVRDLLQGTDALQKTLRPEVFCGTEGSAGKKPLSCHEGQRAWELRQRDQTSAQDQEALAARQAGVDGSSWVEGCEDCPRVGNNRTPRVPEHQALRDSARLSATAASPAHRARGASATGGSCSGVYGGGAEVLRRATRVLPVDLPGDGEACVPCGRSAVVRPEPSLLREVRPDPQGSHCVVLEPTRAKTLLSATRRSGRPSTGDLLLQELESGLLLPRNQAASRSGRGISREGRNYEEARQAQAAEGEGTGLQSSALHHEGDRQGSGRCGDEDRGFAQVRIASVIPAGVHGVWDIEVEGDHSYVAHGFVNHNSSDPINFQNQPRNKNLVRKGYVAYRKGIDKPDLVMLGGDYCLSHDTKIETPAGPRTIEQLQTGHAVYSWNVDKRRVEVQQVEAKLDVGKKPVWRVTTRGGAVVRGSHNHQLYLSDGKVKALRFLSVGDYLLGPKDDIEARKVVYVARTNQTEQMYDIQVSEHHNFILSNGIVSSNSQIELRTAAHLANELNMIDVYSMGGVCVDNNGGPCERYKWYECETCDYEGLPAVPAEGYRVCPNCGESDSTQFKHQARCRHVDLHQRTAEDVNVKRNPLAKNCVVADSLLLTEHGFLEMGEAVTGPGRTKKRIGIVSDDGQIRYTDSTWSPGVKPVIDVHMEYGLKITCTPDHEFFVMRRGKVERVMAADLRPDDPCLIMIGRDVHGSNTELPTVDVNGGPSFKDIDLPTELTTEVARFFGYFVAEGRMITDEDRGYYQMSLGFEDCSSEMVEDFLGCWRSVIGNRNITTWRPKNKDATHYVVASKKLNLWMLNLGFRSGSGEKEIPQCIRTAPWEIKREFFRALFEGDGTNKGPSKKTGKGSYTLSITSKSEKLIRQIHAEMANIAIMGFIRSEMHPTKTGRKRYWSWSIRRQTDLKAFSERIGFVSQVKQEALNRAIEKGVADYSNKFLDGVEPLLGEIYDKTRRKQKDKLREVIHREKNPVRFGDTHLKLLENVLSEELLAFRDAGIWTARFKRIEPAGEAPVFDVYEPEKTAMVIGCNLLADSNFGLLYRMGAPKFCIYADLFDADGMPMVEFAKQLIEAWHDAYPAIADFHEKTEWMLEDNNWIAQTLFGRRRRLHRERRINHFRAVTQGIQFQVSGSAQDIMKIGMIRVVEARNKKIAHAQSAERKLWQRLRMLMQIHDEVLMECPAPIKDEACVMVKEAMESVGKGHLRVPLAFDVKTGKNWEEVH